MEKEMDMREEFCFLPLGGVGEIGMNMSLYGFGPVGEETWIMVDCGISFQDSDQPFTRVIMPDISFVETHLDQLAGIVITHGHEDHIGALPYLWPRLKVPIYATNYTAELIKNKFERIEVKDFPLITVNGMESFEVGPFKISYLALAHSIPEPNALVIESPIGRVLHTGDWRFSHHVPLVGTAVDHEGLEAVRKMDIKAVLGDSTSVFQESGEHDESDLREPFMEICSETEGTVFFSCFASNLERLKTICDVAKDAGRSVIVSGRSLMNNMQAAFGAGYEGQFVDLREEMEFSSIPRNKRVVICTGSQGESRAALHRIVEGNHRNIFAEAGDTVVFSSRTIPGNEKAVLRLKNNLLRREIDYVDNSIKRVHISGHASKDEIVKLYQLIKPPCLIPIHGEPMHFKRHKEVALEAGIPKVVVAYNGDVVRLAPGDVAIEERLASDEYGRLSLEGMRTVPMDSPIVQSRVRAISDGWAVIFLTLDSQGNFLSSPVIETVGLLSFRDDRRLIRDLSSRIEERIQKLNSGERSSEPALQKAVKQVAYRFFGTLTAGRRPMVVVHTFILED